jgi:menaquinone-9 beta-reductase
VEAEPLSNGVMDLGIVGSGPAGAMAAIEAARLGLRVVMWDRATFPRDKVCGEFLSPESIPLLETTIPSGLSHAVPVRRAEFHSKQGRRFSIPLPAPGAGLSRLALDNALWQAATAAGAVCRQAEAVTWVRSLRSPAWDHGANWEVVSATAERARVRELLLACGRWWRVDGLPSPVCSFTKQGNQDGWVGAKAHFTGIDAQDAVEMYFFPGGYCGLAPVEDGIYNACFLVHRSLVGLCEGGRRADFRAWINDAAGHAGLAERLRHAIQASPTIATAPVWPARRKAALGRALAAGDASGFLDPFTGDGISMALHSGQLAARELTCALRRTTPRNPARRYRRQLARSVRRSYFCAALVRSLVRAPAEFQDWITALIPSFLGAKLLSETRWRAETL